MLGVGDYSAPEKIKNGGLGMRRISLTQLRNHKKVARLPGVISASINVINVQGG
jgi:hypothetical protein